MVVLNFYTTIILCISLLIFGIFSIEAGKLLPWQSYQLYPTHRSGTGQKTLKIIPVIPADETSMFALQNIDKKRLLVGSFV